MSARSGLHFCIGLVLWSAPVTLPAQTPVTQIVRDGTVGPPVTVQPVPNSSNVYQIDEGLGLRVGQNVFQSFSLFNLGAGATALFTANPVPTDNVISRVTGGVSSSIFGTIQSNIPGANLYFLNPAGVFFGSTAKLDVKGSFHVSTADVLRMRDQQGNEFLAFSPNSFLRIATPVAFGFLSDHPAPITVQGSKLAVPTGARLDLVGGDISIQGGTLQATGGMIGIASVASKGEVAFDATSLDTSLFSTLGNLSVTGNSRLNVSEYTTEGAGRIAIRAGRFVLNASQLTADVVDSSGGAIDINVRGDVSLVNGASVRSDSDESGNAASIGVTAGTIEISGAAKIASTAAGTGKSSNINVSATQSIAISDSNPNAGSYDTGISSDVTLGSTGPGGDITITTPSLTLQRGAISAETIGLGLSYSTAGRPGNIDIQTNNLSMSDQALITNTSRTYDPSAPGQAVREIVITPLDPSQASSISLAGSGTNIQSAATLATQGGANIKLSASDVSLTGGAAVLATTYGGTADAGNIAISADRVSLSGSSNIQSDATFYYLGGYQYPTGRGGDVSIQANDSITLKADSSSQPRISTSTFGQSSGGQVSLTAHNQNGTGTVTIDDSVVEANNYSDFASASAGQVSVEADVINLQNGGLIGSGTFGPGTAGQVAVGATKSITIEGSDPILGPSGITSSTLGAGSAGDIFLSSPQIVIADGASVDSLTAAAGKGGNIQIGRSQQVPIDTTQLLLEGGGKIAVSSVYSGAGDAGSVAINVGRLSVESGGRIMANTIMGSNGAGGSIVVNASESAVLTGNDPTAPQQASRIEASTNGNGNAGSIVVTTPGLTIQDGAEILAASNSSSAGAGAAGSIFIGSATDPIGSLHLSDGTISAYAVQGPQPGQARQGNINIAANTEVLMESGSAITAGVQTGLGGDIAIAGPNHMVMRDSSKVLATTSVGTGGHIQVGSDVFIKTADSVVSADAGVGTAGIVEIHAPEVDLQGGLSIPAPAFLSASALLQPSCAARPANQPQGRFVVEQRRGLPSSPEGLLQVFDVKMQPAAAIAPKTGTPETSQLARRSLEDGTRAFDSGHFDEAGARWSQAQALYAEIGDSGARSDALRGLAQTQQAFGRHAQSVDTLRLSLKLAEDAKDPVRVASALDSLGNAYLALDQPAAAEENFTRALVTAQEAGDKDLQVTVLNNTGNLHATRRAYDKAIEAYEQSATLAHAAGDILNEAKAWSNAARTAIENQQADRAAALLDRALQAVAGLPEGYDRTEVRIHIGRSYQRLAEITPEKRGQYLLAAYDVFNAAVTAVRKTDDSRSLSYALGNLGTLYQSENRDEEALYLTREALRKAESADAPELLYRWRWQEGQILWARGQTSPAIDSYRRAVDILEQTRQEALSRYGAADTYFRDAVAPVYLDLVRALLDASKMALSAESSHRLLLDARETVEHLKAAELRNYFRDECVADLQARTRNPESVAGQTAVVYPIVMPDRLELLVTLPEGLQRYTVSQPGASVTGEAEAFRRALENPGSQAYLKPAQELYRWLVAPYAESLSRQGVKTIVFIPDGPLLTIPMAALHDGKGFLIERYAVVVAPGLALVDPKPLARGKPKLLAAGLSQSVQGQNPLPAVESELASLHDLFGVEPLLNSGFTTHRLEQELTETHPTIVHIASHAQFSGDAATSWILTYDGRVSMDELSAMVGVAKFRDDPLELLVLSACQTAAGDQRAALGLAGVAFRAGSRSVLGSLWSISDAATSQLIASFYSALKNHEMSRAAALQQAQQALLHSPAFQHPFYWSPFLIIGNWL